MAMGALALGAKTADDATASLLPHMGSCHHSPSQYIQTHGESQRPNDMVLQTHGSQVEHHWPRK